MSLSLTQDAVLSFLLQRGGRARNAELLQHFGDLIGCAEPAERQRNRDLFKRLVNGVAVVQQIDQAKFVVVKKKFRGHGAALSPSPSSPRCASSDDLLNNNNNNNVCGALNLNDEVPPSDAAAAVKVVNLCGDEASRSRRSGAVFAVVAVRSPSHPQRRSGQEEPRQEPSHNPDTAGTRTSAASPGPNRSSSSPCKRGTSTSRNVEVPTPASPPLMKIQNKHPKAGVEARSSELVPLEPLGHQWLVKCAAGLWGQIHALMLRDTSLVKTRDFMSGFTALHWAAKHGCAEMVHKIVNISRKRGVQVDVDSRSHGGHTPLHVAAMHARDEVAVLLVRRYGANVNARDNDGKKPRHYLSQGTPEEVRGLLGGSQHQGEKDGEGREHLRSFNTISKLFQPHKRHKQW